MSVGLAWMVWLVTGAVAGFVAVLSAVAVADARRRRDSSPGAPALPPGTTRVRVGRASSGGTARDAAPQAGASRLSHESAVVGYVTIAADAPAGEEGPAAAVIEARCRRFGWTLLEIVRDRDEGSSLHRPGLRYALERITDGEAEGLVVDDLQRLSRSIMDLGAVMAWFRDADATLVALDLDIDTSTPEGQQVATTLIALSARNHERIASGTRRGLAKGRAEGPPRGRPAVSHRPELVQRIAAMRARNMTLSAIAEQLNVEGVPTLRGGKKWRPSSIQAALGYQRPGPRDHLPSPSRDSDPGRQDRRPSGGGAIRQPDA
jgi:DNA invertase Pin-like site-specific DNA recombinase